MPVKIIKPSYRSYLALLWTRFRGRGLAAALFLTLAFVMSALWAWTGSGDYEPWVNLANLCALTAGTLAAVKNSMNHSLAAGQDRERYSLSYALAYGYVHNFLVGATAAMRKEARPGKLLVFKPVGLDQLGSAFHERFKTSMRGQGFTLDVLKLPDDANRPRSVLSAYRGGETGGPVYYVDFPTTLLTLTSLIQYQSAQAEASGDEAWTPEYQDVLAHTYIERFFKELSVQAENVGIREWIDFTDESLKNLTTP